jgi:cytochrome c-type biogenesis protein CcmH
MLNEGKSPQQVVDFMVERYGDFVLYRPQFKSTTYLLWLGPFLLLVGVLVMLIRRLRAPSSRPEVDEQALARARQILENKEPNQ